MSNDEPSDFQYGCDEFGNKDRFIRQHGNRVRYVPEERQWVVWDGTRWAPNKELVYRLAEETAKSIYDEAKACTDRVGSDALGRWALRSQNKNALDHMLSLADKALSVSVNEFDQEPHLINCKNGLLNLRTGKLEPHSPEHLLRKRTEVNYDPSAGAPLWSEFVSQIFEGDSALSEYVQQLLGYALTGYTTEHCFFLFYGGGRNGKGTLAETILDLMGNYATSTEFNTFLSTDQSAVRVQEAVGRLKGRRYALASETSNNKRFSEALIKKLTGGDTLTGAKLHGDSYEFKPTHKLIFLANHLPAIKDATVAMWERVRVIPFNKQFLGDSQDKQLKEKLWAERDGIFAWLVEGARKYLEAGKLPKIPAVCAEAVSEYRHANDFLSRFIAECTVKEAGATAGVAATHARHVAWCSLNDEEPVPLKYFASAMAERGIKSQIRHKARYFQGIRVLSDIEEPTQPLPKRERDPFYDFPGDPAADRYDDDYPSYPRAPVSYRGSDGLDILQGL